jgi:hypothetical protein
MGHGEANNESLFKDEYGMKRMLAAAGLTAVLAMSGCSQPAEDAAQAADAATVASDAAAADAAAPATPVRAATPAAAPAAPGAPAFAVIYPGGTPSGPVLAAQGPAGPGGILTFTTSATPEEVVAFYRVRAEAAGLKSISSMNRDGVRGYGAGDGAAGSGQLLNVVASPVDDGSTSVQLDWTSGR